MAPENTDIILPDGSVHPVIAPEPEPLTPWEITQAEIHHSGGILEQMRKAQKRLVRATYVEALALRQISER